MFYGYFDPEKNFKIMKTHNFQGDLTDGSAGKEPLATVQVLVVMDTLNDP